MPTTPDRSQPEAGAGASPARPARVGYVMNAFPRLSETFIAHEIHQLERLGLPMHLYAIKREREPLQHPVVARIRSVLQHLPPASSLSGSALLPWLRENLPRFWPAHAALLRRHPWRWASTAGMALGLAWRHRRRDADGRVRLRKVFIKEFLQAGSVAHDVLQRGDIGHLHGHFCHGVTTVTWWAARLAGLGFSFTAHAKDIYQPELNPGRLLERKLGAARFVATCTCANAEVLRARHPRPDDVHAIYHGLDTDWFSPPAVDRRARPPGPIILAVGRLVEKKGFDLLVQACARLRDQGLAFRCHIVGEPGPAGPGLQALIAELGLGGHVQLHGAVAQDALRDVYARARVFALPCRITADGDRDGFPNVLAEAMAMGVPIVTSPISGIPEMVDDGEHGLLVAPGDVSALAEALTRLLADDELHQRLARQGRARICERFDSRRTTLDLHALLARQLDGASGLPRPAAPWAPVGTARRAG